MRQCAGYLSVLFELDMLFLSLFLLSAIHHAQFLCIHLIFPNWWGTLAQLALTSLEWTGRVGFQQTDGNVVAIEAHRVIATSLFLICPHDPYHVSFPFPRPFTTSTHQITLSMHKVTHGKSFTSVSLILSLACEVYTKQS